MRNKNHYLHNNRNKYITFVAMDAEALAQKIRKNKAAALERRRLLNAARQAAVAAAPVQNPSLVSPLGYMQHLNHSHYGNLDQQQFSASNNNNNNHLAQQQQSFQAQKRQKVEQPECTVQHGTMSIQEQWQNANNGTKFSALKPQQRTKEDTKPAPTEEELSELAILRREHELERERHAEQVRLLQQRLNRSEAKCVSLLTQEKRNQSTDEAEEAEKSAGSGAALARQIFDEILKCSICQDGLTDPHILQCGHQYCYECIVRHMSRDAARKTKIQGCPDCRASIVTKPIKFQTSDELCRRLSEALPKEERMEYLDRHKANLELRADTNDALQIAEQWRQGNDGAAILEMPPAVAAAAAAGAAAYEVAERRLNPDRKVGIGEDGQRGYRIHVDYRPKTVEKKKERGGCICSLETCKKEINNGEPRVGVPKGEKSLMGVMIGRTYYHLKCYVFHVGLHKHKVTTDCIDGIAKLEKDDADFLCRHLTVTVSP